jgi:hypothetical protein
MNTHQRDGSTYRKKNRGIGGMKEAMLYRRMRDYLVRQFERENIFRSGTRVPIISSRREFHFCIDYKNDEMFLVKSGQTIGWYER